MLDKRLKWAFLVVALIFAGLPIAGIILDLLTPPTSRSNRQAARRNLLVMPQHLLNP